MLKYADPHYLGWNVNRNKHAIQYSLSQNAKVVIFYFQ